ncbi:uncharacterized protein [Primulina eburnea]|uniref:uncharacterized protein n=1 Tax=Primulina eburnea TaxID=1245227 RepID=UPI003C6C1C5E
MVEMSFKCSSVAFLLALAFLESVQQHDNYFVQKVDALGRPGLSPYQKITAAMRILAYGMAADSTDEYIKIGESTAIESLKRFCRAVVEVFGDWYLRSPNAEDIERILLIGKQRGFPGMLGSLDCMHWKWKNCPTGWAGQYAGRSGKPTIILEAVADYELWIWHAYFGLPAPPANYVIQGKEYTMGYYLADGIYPKWATLVQTIHKVQRRNILQHDKKVVEKMLNEHLEYCNQNERELNVPVTDYREAPIPDVEMALDEHVRFQEFLARHRKIKDKSAHYALRDALIDHLWEEYSNSEY